MTRRDTCERVAQRQWRVRNNEGKRARFRKKKRREKKKEREGARRHEPARSATCRQARSSNRTSTGYHKREESLQQAILAFPSPRARSPLSSCLLPRPPGHLPPPTLSLSRSSSSFVSTRRRKKRERAPKKVEFQEHQWVQCRSIRRG